MNALDFHRRVKRFGKRVIGDPGPAHGLPDPEPFQDRGELLSIPEPRSTIKSPTLSVSTSAPAYSGAWLWT
jgi:hypothetical protein